MKKITQLSLAALTIAICFTACTKDNSSTPQPSVKFTSKTSTALRRDTIAPQVQASKTTSPTTASKDTIAPQVTTATAAPAVSASRDTIAP